MDTADVVQMLATRLRQVDAAELPATKKARLTATLSDTFMRAITVDELAKRLETLEGVLNSRKDKGHR